MIKSALQHICCSRDMVSSEWDFNQSLLHYDNALQSTAMVQYIMSMHYESISSHHGSKNILQSTAMVSIHTIYNESISLWMHYKALPWFQYIMSLLHHECNSRHCHGSNESIALWMQYKALPWFQYIMSLLNYMNALQSTTNKYLGLLQHAVLGPYDSNQQCMVVT
jgi:hypothetical protein